MKKLNEQEALDFVQELISLYFEQRDMDTLEKHMEEYTSWIGTGDSEVCQNLAEAAESLKADFAEYSGSFTIADKCLTFMPFPRCGGVVYGKIRAVPDDKSISDENIRFSAFLDQGENGPTLVHIHFSHPDIYQRYGDYFVKASTPTDSHSLRVKLNARERQLINLTKNIPGGAHQCANDTCLTLLSMSDGFLSMFGYSKEEIQAQFDGQFINMIYPGDRAAIMKSLFTQLKSGSDIELEYRVLQKNGQPIWVLDKGRLIDDGSGGKCFYCILLDITQRKLQEEELRLSLERHEVILDQATDIIFEWDIMKDTLDFSPNWKKRFGYDPIADNILEKIPKSQNIHPDDMGAFVNIMKEAVTGTPYAEIEFRIRDIEGKFYWCRLRATIQCNADNFPIKVIGVIVDIDDEKRKQQKLLIQAQFDTLTGIYNKATTNALVERRMEDKYLSNNIKSCHALMIVDVDYFKSVNDTYGHLAGDSVLSDVASVLKSSVRNSDIVGRIGGDEFLVYLPDVIDEASVSVKTEQMMQALNCIRPESTAPSITCSIGVVVLPRSQNDYTSIYQMADIALYRRKNNGSNGFTFYESEMGEATPSLAVTAVGNAIVSDEGNIADEWLAQYCFRTLYTSNDTETAINKLLEIIGRSFDVSRAYIFECSANKKSCSYTFEWCDDGVVPQMHSRESIMCLGEDCEYKHNFDHKGIFHCHDIKTLPSGVCGILEPQNIKSLLHCAMLDEGDFVGYVGFDECRDNREWNTRQIESFKLTADVLSTFLMKLRQKQRNNNKS